MHEAGHVVAGVVLLKQTCRAAVFAEGGGLAGVGDGLNIPQTEPEAITAAAGTAAESLLGNHPVPKDRPPVSVEARFPELASKLEATYDRYVSDDEAIARWCIKGCEDRPHRWRPRHDWVHDKAARFVTSHRKVIIQVATTLFGSGAITLPALPAKKGHPHVG